MLNKKLNEIAKLVPKNSKVLDVGTDHALLPIYLSQNRVCSTILASDISINALKSAESNLKKYKITDVKLILSDGLDNINDEFDTLILSGMGTDTILKIINGRPLPKTLIISSNNHLYKLRKYMNEIGYSIIKEIAVKDRDKYYDIILYQRKIEKVSNRILKYGKSNNKDYYKYLYRANKQVFLKMNFINKIKSLKKLIELKMLSI